MIISVTHGHITKLPESYLPAFVKIQEYTGLGDPFAEKPREKRLCGCLEERPVDAVYRSVRFSSARHEG